MDKAGRRGVREWKAEQDLIVSIAQAIYYARIGALSEEDRLVKSCSYSYRSFERVQQWQRKLLIREAEAAFEVMRQALLREQLRVGNAEAERVARDAGYQIAPRIAEARRS